MSKATKRKPSIDVFIKAYILTGLTNGKQAAIDAGYSEKTADQQASRLLKSVKVQQAVKEHQEASMKSFIWSKEKKLEILQDTIMACYTADADKGVVNGAVVVSALKEHNAMQGDNAPTQVDNLSSDGSMATGNIILSDKQVASISKKLDEEY